MDESELLSVDIMPQMIILKPEYSFNLLLVSFLSYVFQNTQYLAWQSTTNYYRHTSVHI